MCVARAYLLYFLGYTLFGDKRGIRVTVDYLALLTEVNAISID